MIMMMMMMSGNQFMGIQTKRTRFYYANIWPYIWSSCRVFVVHCAEGKLKDDIIYLLPVRVDSTQKGELGNVVRRFNWNHQSQGLQTWKTQFLITTIPPIAILRSDFPTTLLSRRSSAQNQDMRARSFGLPNTHDAIKRWTTGDDSSIVVMPCLGGRTVVGYNTALSVGTC